MPEKDDKFILMDMNDKRSKKIAEAIGNKTCKKILNYLTDNSDKSEQDIANVLDMRINTVEYNLKKLLETGLIEKTKKFFWSKKGKKIPTYKVARKHIVISPKSIRPSLTALKTILPVIISIGLIIALIALSIPDQKISTEFNKFNSEKELKDFLKDNKIDRGGGILESTIGTMAGATSGADTSSAPKASDYSETNIQVEGVDEADIIKNDGKYIYVVSGNKVVIVNAYPADNMQVLSEIEFENEINIGEILINDDKLIVFASEYAPIFYAQERCLAIDVCPGPSYQEPTTHVFIYDTSDKEDPELENTISVSGNYFSSRMINNYVYVIANQYLYDDVYLPMIMENNENRVIEADEISYSPIKDYSFQYTIILAIDIDNGDTSEEVVLTGRTQNIYVSQNNIYTTYTKYRTWYSEMVDEEKTLITKISIDKDEIKYIASGEVKGHILNQFSMDEYKGNFRIATTVGQVWNDDTPSLNNVYILDKNMELIGELEDLAPGEKIYSVRFMGDRGYVVTFKKVDPLFVIDLADPENPSILGKLKIPGYSDYLHPYDENHIIGIGKDTAEADEDLKDQRNLDFAWYQGVKMAIFDVSDVENPIELHKVVIGDRGTDSDALHNHKAFLFDREKELLVLPITLAEIQGEKTRDNQRGEYTFQGAYVFNINLEDGFDLKGKITHYEDNEVFQKSGYYFRGNRNVQRSLYMDNTLYTFSNELIKANDLDNLNEINSVELGYENSNSGGREIIY